jgi:hypothetical protein
VRYRYFVAWQDGNQSIRTDTVFMAELIRGEEYFDALQNAIARKYPAEFTHTDPKFVAPRPRILSFSRFDD